MVETLVASSALYLAYLSAEAIRLENLRKKIPLRIAVTGTRGKSTLVRMLTAVLKAAGHAVAAKTTGSRTQMRLPDSPWQDFPRRGMPSIIEQKRMIRLAALQQSDTLICEIMSIQRENHHIESQKIIRPHLLIITNIGIDHIEAMGHHKKEAASVLMETIGPGVRIFIPQNVMDGYLSASIRHRRGELITVPEGLFASIKPLPTALKDQFFPRQLDLVSAVATYLKIDHTALFAGLQKVSLDEGAFRIWTCRDSIHKKIRYLVNGFAANEPQSTHTLLTMARQRITGEVKEVYAILNLRPDRGDRTLHWLQELPTTAWDCLTKIYTVGSHGSILQRKLPGRQIIPMKTADAGQIMNRIFRESQETSMIIGMGNFKGTGSRLVEWWQKEGVAIGH